MSSQWIPDGLLPPRKGNEKEYTRMYHKLRRKYDPRYNWAGNERAKLAAMGVKRPRKTRDPWRFPDE